MLARALGPCKYQPGSRISLSLARGQCGTNRSKRISRVPSLSRQDPKAQLAHASIGVVARNEDRRICVTSKYLSKYFPLYQSPDRERRLLRLLPLCATSDGPCRGWGHLGGLRSRDADLWSSDYRWGGPADGHRWPPARRRPWFSHAQVWPRLR